MYPQGELSRLANNRAALCARIARNRLRCAAALTVVVAPVEWIDRMLAMWRRISTPVLLTALPLGFLLKRVIGPKPRILGKLLRWGPLLLGVARNIAKAHHRTRPV